MSTSTRPLLDRPTDVRTDRGDGDGDHDRFSHYVPKAEIARAMVTGEPCIALCGKKWTPSRDPERYPVCPTCKEIYQARAGS